ncbi:MAG TPA: DUF6493 family protein [Thermoguttaceae bacterium]|nr:DUF6493 family protein [Thermoguttaceae bacterium]
MTPEELERVVAEGDPMRVAEACASLDEGQRRKLSKTAMEILKEVRRRKEDYKKEIPDTPLWARMRPWMETWAHPHHHASYLWPAVNVAILAVCPLSSARKAVGGSGDKFDPAIIKVLTDRRPTWIDQWVEHKLQQEHPNVTWNVLRALIRAGVCRKPTSDEYIQMMARGLAPWYYRKGEPSLRQRLVDEPDLLDDLWRLFEVETYALVADVVDDPFATGEKAGWSTTLVQLSAEGHLDRGRLLDSALGALSNDFKNNTLTGYVRLFEKLEPTDEELAARQPTLCDLLSNRASHVVTFALAMLTRVEKAKRLDGQTFVAAVPPVFALRTKTQPKAALAILAQAAKRDAGLVPWALNVVIEAVTHEAADVQERALDLLDQWSPRAHADHATAIRQRLDDLAPSVRGRVEEVLAKIAGPPQPPAQPQKPAEAPAETALDELLARAEGLDPHWRAVAGVDAAIEAIRGGRMPGPLEFDLLDVPLLSATDPLEPIRSLDELIDGVAHAIEQVDSADELERILDGISRFCDRRPEDFERRTEALVKRLRDVQSSATAGHGIVRAAWPSFAMDQLLTIWLCNEYHKPPWYAGEVKGLCRFVEGRLKEQIGRVRARQSAPLLSAPTHAHGWIDPTVLVERAFQLQERRIDVPPHDFAQAMLRLAPDRRSESLEAARKLQGGVGRILRWALGADEGPTKRDKRDAALWLAAGRARDPRGRLAALAVVGIGEDVPDGITPANYSWEARFEQLRWGTPGHLYPGFSFTEHPIAQGAVRPALELTPTLHGDDQRKAIRWAAHTPWAIPWIASAWPLSVDALFVAGVECLMTRLDMASSTFDCHYAFFEPLFEPDRPWSELGHLIAWLGLLSKDADSHTAALDALVEAVADGRVHPGPLGDVLARVAAGGWVKMNRVADSLREVARLSPLHAWTAAEVLRALVGSSPELPRDAHHVLALWLELLVELGSALDPSSRAILEPVKGSSKTARCAKRLLALKPEQSSAKMQAARRQLLEARIARAERWSAAT